MIVFILLLIAVAAFAYWKWPAKVKKEIAKIETTVPAPVAASVVDPPKAA